MRTKTRRKKPEIRWDYQPCGQWVNEFQFNDTQKTDLKKICDLEGFVEAVRAVSELCVSLFDASPPTPSVDMDRDEFAREKALHRKQHLQPTKADMKATIVDLEKTVDFF